MAEPMKDLQFNFLRITPLLHHSNTPVFMMTAVIMTPLPFLSTGSARLLFPDKFGRKQHSLNTYPHL